MIESKRFTEQYLTDLLKVVQEISRDDIQNVIQILFQAWHDGRQVFLAGNGGSASTATHFASDLSKFVSIEGKARFRAIALTNNIPWITALTNDLGWQCIYVEQLRNLMRKGDVLVAISVHGGSGKDKAGPWSQNLMQAAKFVIEEGGRVVGFAGFDGGMLKEVADACVVVPIDSTPQVEGFHLVLTHLVCAALRDLIEKYDGERGGKA